MSEKLIKAVAQAIADETCSDFRPYTDEARVAIAAIEAAGYRIVPVEPTEAIADAFTFLGTSTFRERYAAMLAAAPKVLP